MLVLMGDVAAKQIGSSQSVVDSLGTLRKNSAEERSGHRNWKAPSGDLA